MIFFATPGMTETEDSGCHTKGLLQINNVNNFIAILRETKNLV